MILCVFTMGLVACGDGGDDEFDNITGTVYGNGGMAVVKGEYVFFVNGFMKAEDMTDKEDNYTGDKVGALMVAKLDQNGELVLDENDLLDDEYYKVLSTKLAGFEASDLSIYGDYLYFTSPCQQDAGKEWAKKRVDFCRIKLSGGDVERIYQSEVEHDKLEFAYYNNGGVYLMVWEKEANLDHAEIESALYCVDATSCDKKLVAEDVKSVSISDNNAKYVYFVKTGDDGDVLVRYNYAGNKQDDIRTADSVEVKFADSDYVYIVKPSSESATRKELARAAVEAGDQFVKVCYSDLYKELYLTPDGKAVIAVADGYVDCYAFGHQGSNDLVPEDVDDSIKFVGIANGSFVYISGDKTVKSVSYSDLISGKVPEVITVATVDGLDTTYFDIDDQYVYFYKTINETKYLHRLLINNNENTSAEEMMGVYLDADMPEVETETEE